MTRTTITALVRGKTVELPVDQVIYFKADCKYTAAVHQGGELILDETLKSLEADLSGRFLRIHRSTLVPLDRLVSISRDKNGSEYLLTLAGAPKPLPISRRKISQVRQAIAKRRSAA
ncbi:LytTR family DNA-binding domain-containing protein [Azotobacter chroococcum]|uniref:LytTR family DNA-binding domain-containing protein n=1 Tax=Azotobacter chroococcum TaxID=353 RepID=UPI0010AE594A|nr:LytTR family DNA-binding domain-containing protein [Azotobacter chroococcum]TKD30018.1 LytTR family transcriptional regulator [Azotobacter chroococcum]